jgi:peptidoglycan/LPS O-acetylase OafA/YrhL
MGTVKINKPTSDFMDALRGVSALVVAVVHAFQIFIIPYCGYWTYPHLLTSLVATYAIVAFFIVSGFMIHLSVQRHRTNGEFNSYGFARARILRIYPPLIVAILITIVVYLVISGFALHGAESYRLGGELNVVRESATLEWSAIPSTFFLLYGAVPDASPPLNMDGPLWTLGYEWWFYILAFLTARLLNGINWRTIVPLAFVVLMLLYGRNIMFLQFLLIWASGFALGFFYARGLIFARRARSLIFLLAAVLLVVAIFVGRSKLGSLILTPHYSETSNWIMAITGMIFTLGIGLMITRIDASDMRLPQLLTGTASFSYTIYVVHFPLLLLSYSLLHPLIHGKSWMVAALAAIGATILIACIAERLSRIVENRALLSRGFDDAVRVIPALGRHVLSRRLRKY